ncbi:MAG: WbqC family protein [Tepidisphaeraceae bacterium]
MAKRIAILQSSYIPWKGYFDLIRAVDEFILFDDVQYTRQDWRNRNIVKTPRGAQWLTVPVKGKGKFGQTIEETLVSDPHWARRHWQVIAHNYRGAPFFAQYRPAFETAYLECREERLSRINHRFLTLICSLLNIRTKISWSRDYVVSEGKTQRLVELCRQAGATEYLSGPAARDYIQPELFAEGGIGLRYVDYDGYPEYPQLFPPFEHKVSVVDLLFNTGPDALRHMKAL